MFIKSRDNLIYDSIVLLEQLRTIDKIRLIKKLSKLDYREMIHVDDCLAISIGL